MTGHGANSANGREIPAEILREILLRLPTRDVTRCSAVSWQWFFVVKNPTFRKLHAASHAVAAAPSEVLLVSERQDKYRSFVEASISNVSLQKPMCHISLPPEYRLTNVCGGFLCFAPATMHMEVSPVFVCNPVTGKTLALPRPPMRGLDDLVALGFSPFTQELKLFRYTRTGLMTTDNNKYLDVYTLGESSGWRRRLYLCQHSPVHGGHLPVLVDGKLYVLIDSYDGDGRWTHRILVIDVASEMHRTYRLPRIEANTPVNAFELRGRLCLAVNTGEWEHHPKVQFWVMPPLDWLNATTNDDNTKLNWDLLYSFDLDSKKVSRSWSNAPRGAWLEDDEILCYRLGNKLYKYDTSGHSLFANNEPMQWNHKLLLPPTPKKTYRRWGIYSGYRSNLLSPLIFRPPPSEEEEKIIQFENVLLETLRLNKSKGLSAADTR